MPAWRIERLNDAHDRAAFDCGQPSLDDFLKRLAGQYERRDFAALYVATVPPSSTVLGYYTLSGGAIDLAALPEAVRKKLPRHPVPVVHLGRLAVDRSARGQGLGRQLLLDALRVCTELAAKVALHAVEVRAIDDEARRSYQKYGFEPLMDDPLHLYLSMKVIRKLNLGG
ncbi:MAG TPA: GNAT family N-acetyltransferase [Gemmataceae bacterium]|nr:GNAT family N-acetyltransferase [Gemmataceae bacterium]